MLLARFAPLLLLAAAPSERRIDVALANFKFTPATITLDHGGAYVLHLTSTGGHSFAAKTFFAAATMSPAERAKVAGGKIDLEGGDSADIRFVAPSPGPTKSPARISCIAASA